MERIEFDCAECDRRLRVQPRHAGGPVRCPYCRAVVTAPSAEPEPAPQPEPPLAHPAAAPKPKAAPDAQRKPCPTCAEPIWADAKKCRYCGEYVDPSAAPRSARRFNPFSLTALLLVFGASVASAAVFFLAWDFRASVWTGAAMCLAAAALGITGVVYAIARRARGAVSGVLAVVFGLAGLGLFMASLSMARPMAEAIKGFSPELAAVIDPRVTGGKDVVMQCTACGHQTTLQAKDVAQHRVRGASDLIGGGGGDINAVLDKAEKRGGMGMGCPACGKATLQSTIVCEHCGEHFLPPWSTGELALEGVTCPACGRKQKGKGLYGIDQDAMQDAIKGMDGLNELLRQAGEESP